MNTKPLVYGFKHEDAIENMQLVEDYPSKIATMLLNDEIDVGLVPVTIIPRLSEHYIISDYCIGAVGPVASVCLFSDVPMQNIERVLLDYHSHTSAALAKMLLKDHWHVLPELEDAKEDFREYIKDTTGGLVIGDRAFEQRRQSHYVYDLAEAWVNFTGLPFVFAAWVANKKLPKEFIGKFNEANRVGVENIDAVIAENPYTLYDMNKYFTQNISYLLTDEKRKGLKKFLEMLREKTD